MRTSPERREMLLLEFERSGMSGAAFSAMIGINYTTFAGWRQQRNRRRRPKSGSSGPLQLVEAVVAPRSDERPADHGLTIHLPGDARMELSHADQLPLMSALLKSLQASG